MKHDEGKRQTPLSNLLPNEMEWRIRLNHLAFKGINEWDLEHWDWILAAEDPDSRIERFVANEAHKPIFILNQLLGKDESIKHGSSILAVIKYISRHYCRPPIQDDTPMAWGTIRRTLDARHNMAPDEFKNLLRRLVYHCSRVWPSAIVSVSQAAAEYIKSIPINSAPDRTSGYAQRTMVFNYALKLFERPARSEPLRHRRDNWNAQKVLLNMSLGLDKPLVINNDAYRAIRMVMIGLPKSDPEQRVATRLTASWPPYREIWDGIDEQRQPQDNLSMSVKAGALSREAGNAESNIDRSLGHLGGAVLGETSSIQTRSLPPRIWQGRDASANIYISWAARVRATRNAHEAWEMFNDKPDPHIKPNFQVYAELFQKLYAREAHSWNLPGDGREHFPVYDANLTDVEKARVAPPGANELYKRMLSEGCRPVGKCLVILVRHAPNLGFARRCLIDSGLDKEIIENLTDSPLPQFTMLSRIPLPIFNAYIRLLCRIQPNYLERARPKRHRSGFMDRFKQLKRVLLLLETRFPRRLQMRDLAYKAPWYEFLGTLALRHKTFHPDKSLQSTDTESLRLFLSIYARRQLGPDTTMFFLMNSMLRKVFRWRHQSTLTNIATTDVINPQTPVMISDTREFDEEYFDKLTTLAFTKLKEMFDQFTTPAQSPETDGTGVEIPPFFHTIRAQHLHIYLRTLALFKDEDEIVKVMYWVLEAWELDSVLEDAKNPDNKGQYGMMARIFTFFRAYGDRFMDPETMSRFESQLHTLNKTKGCTWHWPSDEEVEGYIAYDSQEASPSLFGLLSKQAQIDAAKLAQGDIDASRPRDHDSVNIIRGVEGELKDVENLLEGFDQFKEYEEDQEIEEEEEEDVDDKTLMKQRKFGSRRSSRQRRGKKR